MKPPKRKKTGLIRISLAALALVTGCGELRENLNPIAYTEPAPIVEQNRRSEKEKRFDQAKQQILSKVSPSKKAEA
ncbi:unnamed protein product, partial [marine sediment metagenome]